MFVRPRFARTSPKGGRERATAPVPSTSAHWCVPGSRRPDGARAPRTLCTHQSGLGTFSVSDVSRLGPGASFGPRRTAAHIIANVGSVVRRSVNSRRHTSRPTLPRPRSSRSRVRAASPGTSGASMTSTPRSAIVPVSRLRAKPRFTLRVTRLATKDC